MTVTWYAGVCQLIIPGDKKEFDDNGDDSDGQY